ncbi:MAG: DUF1674 domain-containing protein [Methylocella sp.]
MQRLSEPENQPNEKDSAATTQDPRSAAGGKALSPEAQRALAEAEERRRLKANRDETRQKELNGRDGPEPVRYGDWEVKGIATDF